MVISRPSCLVASRSLCLSDLTCTNPGRLWHVYFLLLISTFEQNLKTVGKYLQSRELALAVYEVNKILFLTKLCILFIYYIYIPPISLIRWLWAESYFISRENLEYLSTKQKHCARKRKTKYLLSQSSLMQQNEHFGERMI